MQYVGNNEITAKYAGNTEVLKQYVGDTLVWENTPPTHDYSQDYLTFRITSSGNIYWNGSGTYRKTIQYSKDSGATWTTITASTSQTITVVEGDVVMFKGVNDTYGKSTGSSCFKNSTAGFVVEGNIMSLQYGDDFEDETELKQGEFTFYMIFAGCSGMTSAENLILPATNLSGRSSCYSYMFSGCTSLTTAPELPATTLGTSCYSYMYKGCTVLNYIKCLATDISASNCVNNWVQNVAASGTFVKASGVSWSTGASGIPSGWTVLEE